MPRSLGEHTIKQVPLLREDEIVGEAVRRIMEASVPALPVVNEDGRYRGIFGEREFIGAIFPGYLAELGSAAFVTEALETELEKRQSCQLEPVAKYMNTEHIDVGGKWSDAQLAETFLHHRVLIIPVVEDGEVRGIVTRWDFFRALAESLLNRD
jgi:CBS domain-containing protein